MKKSKDDKNTDNTIALNRRARHDYFIEDSFEAGIVLQGWEVKSLRAKKGNIAEGYVIIRQNELFLLNAQITPLLSASTHIDPQPSRTRKLLVQRTQINKLIGKVERKGYTLMPLKMYWRDGLAKLEVGIAKGKKEHDKRDTEKAKDFVREKGRIMRNKG